MQRTTNSTLRSADLAFLDVEQIQAQCIHQHNSLSQPPNTHISWPCQLCIRIILLVVHSPSLPHIINQIRCHSLPPSDSATDRFKEGLYANLEDPEQIPVEVAPLRIKHHLEPSTQLENPEINIESEVIKVFRASFERAKRNKYRNSPMMDFKWRYICHQKFINRSAN